MNKLVIGLGLSIAIFWGLTMFTRTKVERAMFINRSAKDVMELFPQSPQKIEQLTERSLTTAQEAVKQIIAIPAQERTFDNTFGALDRLCSLSNYAIAGSVISILEMVSPDKAIRDAAHAAIIKFQNFSVDNISNNVELYRALKSYVEGNAAHETLTHEQDYFMTESMKDFQRSGLDLPDDQLNEVRRLKKELATLELNFSTNIAQDNRTLLFTQQELQGVDQESIAALKKSEDGKFIVGVDYPTYHNIMQNCSVADTRKQLNLLFENRAYPVNEEVLKDIIAKRDELANKLGFDSYAALDISDQMVKTPEHAQQFLAELLQKVAVKEQQEYMQLFSDLPEGVTLTADRTLQPWDAAYASNYYKKKYYNVDEVEIANYFPMEKTVQGLLDIYQQFFGLTFKEVAVSCAWHQDVRMLEVHDTKSGDLLGYFLLDLYPRDNKYSHACHASVVSSTYDINNQAIPAVSIVIANFPQSTPTKPSLLKRSDVSTFFHEFGHALHALLGRTHIASLAGTSVKRDFVEMPSQMLEEWLWDPSMLKQVSGHYQTGEPLSDELITRMLKSKNFGSGRFVQTQVFYATMSLDFFKKGAQKDVFAIYRDLYKKMFKHVAFSDQKHMYAAFGHLTGYGAKYYGYLWSKVFALDLFAEIKKHGLLNPEIGQKYVHNVIGRGGSDDPMNLLKNFLGREPNQEAFLKDLGLDEVRESKVVKPTSVFEPATV